MGCTPAQRHAQAHKHSASTFWAAVYVLYNKINASYLYHNMWVTFKVDYFSSSLLLRWTCRVWTGKMFQLNNSSRAKSDPAELDHPFGRRRWRKVNHCRGLWLPADTRPTASLPGVRFLPSVHSYFQCQGCYGSRPKCTAPPPPYLEAEYHS